MSDPGGTAMAPSFPMFPPPIGDIAKKPSPAPPLSRLLGNKDFVITISCKSDFVTVTPGGYTFRWSADNAKETDQALIASVKNLIARRQASVQPGEPPYQPILRFHVSSDGRNTLYRAYPLLETIGVPMTRENATQ
jgi:hypothetical protein